MNFNFPATLLISLLFAVTVNAQQFGGNPPSIKWKQINTDTVRVIFPVGLESLANQVATISTELSKATAGSIGDRIRKIDIVLQNETTISNGYVSLGPYRSEFHIVPDPNSFSLGSLPWVSSLGAHEYRHVQQYNNFRKGFASVFYVLFGQEGQALANALTIPDWFFEGDAVYQETLVSNQGRGRLPYFFNGYRSLWAEGKNYPYMKLRNGSLRDFVPNHYPLGYMFVAYGQEKHGEDFWRKVTADAASWKGLFYPFQKAIRKYSNTSFKRFRTDAINFFRDSLQGVTGAGKHFVSDQEYPYFIDSISLVYLNSSYKRIPHFVIRSGDVEKKLRVRDISTDNYFSYRNGKIVYASFKPDLRWGWRDFSELRVIDITDGSQVAITKKTKYYSPDISPDGKQIVAVHVNEMGASALHLLRIDGTIEKEFPNNDGLFYTYPKFYGDRIVSPVRNARGEMSIAIIELTTGNTRFLLPFTQTVIGFPSAHNEAIYFTASHHGRDRIFRWENDQLYFVSVTDSDQTRLGNYQINAYAGKLAWTRFTASGYRLMFANREDEADERLASAQISLDDTAFGVRSISDPLNELLLQPSSNYPVNKYSKSFRLFNFHSRRPYINDPDYSFSFVSENILNTLQSEIFLNYNRNEKYKQLGFAAQYGGWFPMLRLETQYTLDRNARIRTNAPRVYWNEWESSLGASVPLNLTGGRTFTYITTGADYVYNKRYFTGLYKDSFENRAFGYMNAFVSFSNQVQRARQHIHPRFAQTLNLNYKRAVTNLDGNQFLASGSIYLPGMFVNHSLVLQAAWHQRDTLNDIRFSNSFPFSRGYANNNFYQMWKLGVNYHLPLLYPDWGFANLVYFLRIRANVFYDYTGIEDFNNANAQTRLDFRSYGTEIFFDTKWWNQLPVSFGIRYSRLLDHDIEGRGANQFEFVLPVNLLSR